MKKRFMAILVFNMPLCKRSGGQNTLIFMCFRCIIVLFAANHQRVGAILMWTAPPPAWNQTVQGTDPANIQATVIQVLNGTTNYYLRWDYSLSADQSISLTFFSMNDGINPQDDVGFVVQGGSSTVYDRRNYRTRFSIDSTNEFSTLTINTVTERENATFQCRISLTAGSSWAYNVRIEVTDPPDINHISDNQTVIQYDNVTLNCTANGLPPPSITWTRLSNNSVVTFPLTIKKQDQGGYRCTANNSIGRPATKDVFITVLYPPSITYISGNQTVNETDTLSLMCRADGNPAPNITWTRLSDNSVVPLPLTITGKQDEGSYRCTADNGDDNPASKDVFITVQNYHPINTNLITPDLPKNTVAVNASFNLTCSAQANPPAKYRFYKEEEILFTTTSGGYLAVYTTSVKERIKQVPYSCTPFNDFGDGPTETITVTVHFNPLMVTLVTNTTENEDCSESMRVNFTCVASDANPAVTNYQLLESGDDSSVSSSGTWIKKISKGGNHAYSCLAGHPVGNVTSAITVTLTLNVPVQISLNFAYGNVTLEQGGDVYLYCNVTGFPPPTVTWTKDSVAVRAERTSWLNFTNINKNENGIYACHANNTCGKSSSSERGINVLYKPENVNLTTSSISVCKGNVVTFTCTADANPAVHTYRLYENGAMIENLGGSGITKRALNTSGQFKYICDASNSVGTGTSSNTVLTVEVPVQISVNVVYGSETSKEGGNVSLYCNVTGFPEPTVTWAKDGVDDPVARTPWLNFTNINRRESGNYTCHANNTCGKNSSPERRVRRINVLYSPSATGAGWNISLAMGNRVFFPCPVGGNPEPNITWYKGSDASGTIIYRGKLLDFPQTKESDTGFYTCSASNSLGTPVNVTHYLLVDLVSPSTTSQTTPKGTTEVVLRITLTILNKDCDNFLEDEFLKEVEKLLGRSLTKVDVVRTRCGSVIVDLVLRFNQSVNESDVMSVMKTAAQQNNFGNFIVEPNSIRQTLPSPTGSPSPNTSLSTTGRRSPEEITEIIRITLTVTNKDCQTFPEGEFRTKVEGIFRHLGLKSFEIKTRCGSVIIDLVLVFNQSMNKSDVISALKTAAQQDKFGKSSVDPDSIKQTSQSPTASTSPTSKGGTQASVCKKTWIKNTDCSSIVWVIVVLSLAGVVVIALVIGIAAWCVHKKRQHGKNCRTQVFEFQERPRYS